MSNSSKSTGRPPHDPPAGWVTIRQAADAREVSYSVVYRHARTGLVRAEQLANGVILVWSGDLEKISKHEAPPNRHRIAVQLAPRAARHAAWMRAAKAQRMTVTALAYQLLDQAAGYSS